MAVAQAEFNVLKPEITDEAKNIEEAVKHTIYDIKALQDATSLISLQAAPWSTSIEVAVNASEAKAQAAFTGVRSFHGDICGKPTSSTLRCVRG